MFLKEIGLPAQNLLTILGSTVNIIGGTYMITYGNLEPHKYKVFNF